MYSSARKMSTLSAICCAVNIVGIILFLLISASLKLSFAASFAIIMILVSSAAISFMLTLAMRSLCQDLEYEYENMAIKLRELNKKIDDLQYK